MSRALDDAVRATVYDALRTDDGRAALRPFIVDVLRAELATLRPAPPTDADELTLAEAARLIGCSVKTLRRAIAAGTLPATRDGRGRLLVRRGDMLATRGVR